GGRGRLVDARRQSLLKSAIDSMETEGAFFDNASRTPGYLGLTPCRYGRILATKLLPVESTSIIWAGHFAVPASDATIVVHHHDSVRSLVRSSNWTDVGAGRVGALHTGNRHERFSLARFARLDNSAPAHIRGDIIVRFAGQHTVIATNALGLVNHHSPTMFALLVRLRRLHAFSHEARPDHGHGKAADSQFQEVAPCQFFIFHVIPQSLLIRRL
ncbi:MAG: hypothetical protein R3330_07185, partial [Saprospiraceae bacterium]|nr:hypothetical protein [Saprospiraceae bacterium]